jgi:hypothetical protein
LSQDIAPRRPFFHCFFPSNIVFSLETLFEAPEKCFGRFKHCFTASNIVFSRQTMFEAVEFCYRALSTVKRPKRWKNLRKTQKMAWCSLNGADGLPKGPAARSAGISRRRGRKGLLKKSLAVHQHFISAATEEAPKGW